MARSNRSTTSSSRRSTSTRKSVSRAAPVASTPAPRATNTEKIYNTTRKLTNYTFMYQRDRVSRTAGSSGLAIAANSNGETMMMTLQEAKSLYNFLHNALNNNQ